MSHRPKRAVFKPATLSEYLEWAKSTLHADFTEDQSRSLYDVNVQTAFNTVAQHPFFIHLGTRLHAWSLEYEAATHSHLLMSGDAPRLLMKPFASAVNKSFRTNVLWNRGFPRPPKHGWVTPANLFSYFNDSIRTTLVCKFIDGPGTIVQHLEQYAKETNILSRWYTQARDDGYYAYHFYVTIEVNFYDASWRVQRLPLTVEIQVTTQLQDILRGLTHQLYEQNRLAAEPETAEWKWDYRSDRFQASYLSHTLHLLEALVVQARDGSLAGRSARPDAEREGAE